MHRAICFGVFALLLPTSAPQTGPDVPEILKQVGKTYSSVAQYSFVAESTVEEKGKPPVLAHVTFAFQSPGKYRMQGAIPGMSNNDPHLENALAVHDGSTLWFFFPKMNQYGSIPSWQLNEAAGDMNDASPKSMDGFLIGRFRSAAAYTAGAKFLREETIEVAGRKMDSYVCRVVVVPPDSSESPRTWWIDKRSYRILREEDANAARTSTTVFTEWKLDEPLPDDLFKFTPPPGARNASPGR